MPSLDAIDVLAFPMLNDEVNLAILSNRLQRDVNLADLLFGQSPESQSSQRRLPFLFIRSIHVPLLDSAQWRVRRRMPGPR